jgi:hypothetical protein
MRWLKKAYVRAVAKPDLGTLARMNAHIAEIEALINQAKKKRGTKIESGH